MPAEIKIEHSKLEELYIQKQYSIKKTAETLNLSRNCVRNNLIRQSIPLRTHSEAIKLAPGFRDMPRDGERNPCWRGGRITHGGGYVAIKWREHPRADKRGYVYEHILVWEKVHNRPLPSGWVIHHLNGIRNDNRPENLVAIPRAGHARRELGELFKRRIRELEAKVKLLEKALDSQQMIWWGEN